MAHSVNENTTGEQSTPYVKTAAVSAGQIVNNLKTDGTRMGKDLFALAKIELSAIAKHAGIGGGMFGAAGYLALNALSLLFMSGGFAFSLLFYKLAKWSVLTSVTLGFICMAIVLLVIAGILALLGKKQFEHVGAPEQTIDEAKKTVDTLKSSVDRGNNAVKADALARQELETTKKQAKEAEKAEKQARKDAEKQAKEVRTTSVVPTQATTVTTVTAPADSVTTVTPNAAGVTTVTTDTTTAGTVPASDSTLPSAAPRRGDSTTL